MLFVDLWVMLDAVRQHVKTTGPVVLADDPMLRVLGFKSAVTSESWGISLTDVKRALVASRDNPEKQAQVQAMQIVENRLKLVS